ncbi:MAG: hypothetical protein WC340_10780 [Kiritimatiellia bacterium]
MKQRHKERKKILVFALAALLCTLVHALTICGKCGHEVKDDAAICAHCKAAVAKEVKAAEPESMVAAAGDTIGEIAAAFVEKQYKLAEQHAEHPGLAFAIYQNAFAVLRLVPSDERSMRIGKALVLNMNKSRQELMFGNVPCRMCQGTGKLKVDLGKVDGSKNIKFVDGMKCKRCGGLGYRREYLSVDRIKMNVLKGRQSFEQMCMVAGEVKQGRVYLSEELVGKLDIEQRALVMTGLPVPCKECQHTGLQICRSCKGLKWERCPADNCKGGVIERPAGGLRGTVKKRLNDPLVEICGRCEGSGEIPCRICQGKGSVICVKCGGTGEAPPCARCSGIGLVTCTRCGGTGKYRDEICSKCAGEGKFLCTSCKGEGSVSK